MNLTGLVTWAWTGPNWSSGRSATAGSTPRFS